MTNNELIDKLYFIRNFKLGVYLFTHEYVSRTIVLLFIDPSYLEKHIPSEIIEGEFSVRYATFSKSVLKGIDMLTIYEKYRDQVMGEDTIESMKQEIEIALSKKYGEFVKEALRFEFGRHFITN